MYIPRSLWPEVRDRAIADMKTMKVGDVSDFTNFMGAVIDERAYTRITGYQQLAHTTAQVLQGDCHKDVAIVQPTLVQVEARSIAS